MKTAFAGKNSWKMESVRFAWCVLSLLFATTASRSQEAATPVASLSLVRTVNITRRATLDEFDLTVPSAAKRCDNYTRVLGNALRANCSGWREQAIAAGSCHLRCRCRLGNASSFLVNEKRCADERILRKGCNYVFGSWAWKTGWTWNSQGHPLEVLSLKEAFSLTIALNASTDKFKECEITSKATYDRNGEWSLLNAFSNASQVVFFKFRQMWHMSWIISDMPRSEKDKIEGRFLRFYVTCTHTNIVDGGIESSDTSSCVVFKVTGNLTHSYSLNSTSKNDTAIRPMTTFGPTAYKTTERIKSRSSGWILGVTIGGSLFIIAWLAALFLCCKKSTCAKQNVSTERHLRYSPDNKMEASV